MKSKQVLAYTRRLDTIANDVQENWRSYGMNKRAAYDFCLQVDHLSDRLEQMAGVDREALVFEHDADEPYMDHFNAPEVLEQDADEPYMQHMDDDGKAEFHSPLEGEDSDELIGASFDYWDDSVDASGDYWDDEYVVASGDYWNDDLNF